MNSNVFNNSGALTDLLNKLKENSVYGFNSVTEIIEYKRYYKNKIDTIMSDNLNKVLIEIDILEENERNINQEYEVKKSEQITKINNEINRLKTILDEMNNRLLNIIKKYFISKKLKNIELKYDYFVELPLKNILHEKQSIENKLLYLKNNQENEVHKRSKDSVNKIEYTVSVLNSFSSLIYGSVGEIKAIELLKQLPEDYYIINDFRERFDPPIFNKNENDRIYSIQLDHVVVGPTGVYIIETKYWNRKSIENNFLFSPIQQLKRGSYALFILLNNTIKERRSSVFSNNWGQFKISISNILLMMNASTKEQFQYVKILTENNLINYITKRRIVFNEEQIKYIVKILK
jgi:hypothetical protein